MYIYLYKNYIFARPKQFKMTLFECA